jgi:peptidoglycan/xylan/chitin deacetylase (PgdA/CDA1 family)
VARAFRRIVVRTGYALLYVSGVIRLAYWLGRNRQVVVTYHNVLPDRLVDDSLHGREAHAASVFSRQLAVIRRRFPVTTELGRPGSCVIAFDDGYSNNARIAGPLLAESGALAYFFVPLETARDGQPNWVDKLRLWIGAAPSGTYSICGTEITLDDIASRHRAADALWQIIEQDYAKRDALLADMHRAVPFEALPIDPELRALRYDTMTIPELGQLAAAGHKIGCHSRSHDILSRLSEHDLAADFRDCAAYRGSLYNTGVYAYPFGGVAHVNEWVIAACRRAGFSAALIYLPSLDGTALEPGPFTIPRQTLPNTASRFVIEAKLSGVDVVIRRLVRRVSHRADPRLDRIAQA